MAAPVRQASIARCERVTDAGRMNRRRTARFFAAIVVLCAALLAPALFWDGYLDSPLGVVAVMPYLSIYLFHAAGIPGLLQNGGACGWGWCAPTLFGWIFLVAVWLGIAWLLAWALAALTAANTGDRPQPPPPPA